MQFGKLKKSQDEIVLTLFLFYEHRPIGPAGSYRPGSSMPLSIL